MPTCSLGSPSMRSSMRVGPLSLSNDQCPPVRTLSHGLSFGGIPEFQVTFSVLTTDPFSDSRLFNLNLEYPKFIRMDLATSHPLQR